MKILTIFVCFSLAQVLRANDLIAAKSLHNDVNDVMISRIIEGLRDIKSAACRRDLNSTVNAFYERQSWAVASKILRRSVTQRELL